MVFFPDDINSSLPLNAPVDQSIGKSNSSFNQRLPIFFYGHTLVNKPNAHGFCPWVASLEGYPKHLNLQKIKMETADKKLAKLKRDFFNLVLEISKLRYKGKEPPFALIMQAQKIGRLAHISEHQLDKLLFS